MSENITAAIALNGEMVMKQPLIKSMRVVKKETLKLISDWVSRSNDHQMVSVHFFFFLLESLIIEFPVINNIVLIGFGKFHTTIIGRSLTGLSENERSLCSRA